MAKTIEDIAREVINGSWGNGANRKASLTNAGYDADAVQNVVDKMMSGNYTPTTQTTPTTPTTSTTTSTVGDGFKYDEFKYDPYTESDSVKKLKEQLDLQLANKPSDYQSQWQNQLDETIKKILNREDFKYDFNGDALYQQYKDKYIQQGKMAMQDAIGQASAMTGGYGNSYASTVGNQAYQSYLQNLNDIIPELYQMAYDKYNQEGQDLYNQYAMLGERENADYNRYRDTVADWQTERDYITNRYDSERNYDYSKYTDNRNFDYNKYSDNKQYAYNDYRDKISDAQWQAQFDEAKKQYEQDLAYKYNQLNQEKDLAYAKTTQQDDDNEVTPTKTDNTDNFIENVQTYNEFIRHRSNSGKNYKDYIKSELEKQDLTEGEYAWLEAYYELD